MSSSRQWRRRAASIVVGTLVVTACAVVQVASPASAAIESPLTLGYDQQIYGDFLQAGNAVLGCPSTPATQAADCRSAAGRTTPKSGDNVNDDFVMTAVGATGSGIFNSSSASVTIPAGASVDYAQLVWAGTTGVYKGSSTLKCGSNSAAATPPPGSPSTTPVKLTVGTNSPVSITAGRLTTDTLANITGAQYYSAAADVTSAFGNATTGSSLTVNVANVWTPQGYNCFGGWSIIVVYKYPTANANAPNKREVFLYDGHVRQASTDAATTTTISGFKANGQAKVGVVAYEGDWGIDGDQFSINGTAQTDPGSPPAGTSANFFTSYAQGRVGDTAVNNYSVDTKTFDVATSVIKKGDTSARLTFSTSGDSYLAEELVMSIPVPALAITKSVSPTTVHPGDPLTWTITVTNPTDADASNVAVTDALVPTCARTIGALAAGRSTTFTCTSTAPNATVTNTANVTGTDSFNTPLSATGQATATVLNPAITISKTADQTGYHVGDPVTYTIVVTNTGNAALSGVAVTDPTNASCAKSIGALAAGDSTTYTCTDTAPVPNNANTATVTGADALGRGVTANSTAPVPVIHPALTLTKTPAPTTVTAAGQNVTYTFKVTNSGDSPVSGITIADTPVAPGGVPATITCAATTLAAGASTTCTGSYTTTQADVDQGSIKDTAVANGKDQLGSAVASNAATATVTVPASPALTLVKAATPAVVSSVGATVSYAFTVRNTGNVTVTGVTLTDAFDNTSVVPPAISCPTTTLAPGESVRCTAAYTSTQADFDQGSINNTAQATGRTPTGATTTSNQSSASVTASSAPSLSLVKTASPTTVTAANQTVTYSFLVTNTGNQTLSGLTIADTFTAPAGPVPAITCPKTSLAPGASTTCTGTYTVTQADVNKGSIKNAAVAQSVNPKGGAVNSAQSNATVTVTQRPALTLVKTADPTTVTAAGQPVTYSFQVTNSGNVTVDNLAVTDALAAPAGPEPTVTCPVTSLVPGAVTICTGTYAVKQADVDHGTVKNSATAGGTDPTGAAVTSNVSSATVTVTRSATLSLVKSAAPATVNAVNQTVTYSFLVTNTGNQTLTGLSVTDTLSAPAGPPLTISCPATTLAPRASTTCTATYKTLQADLDAGVINNSAVAGAKDPANGTVTSNTSAATVTAAQGAALTLAKTASPSTVTAAGQSVTYSFVVTNSGNTTVSAVAVSDPMFPGASAPACPVTTLAPGTSTTCTATYTTTQDDVNAGRIVNTATATGKNPKGGAVTSDPATATVTVTQTATLSLTKSADPASVTAAGQTVSYTFTVKNTGNVTVTGVAVADTFTAPAGPPLAAITCAATTLLPGATTTCTASYRTTQADINAGSIANSAVATGRNPANGTVTSNTSTATVSASRTPKLTLVKTAAPTTVRTEGSTVTYTFAVTNSGNVTVSGLSVADTFSAPAGPPLTPITCVDTTLTPGATTTCTATYAVTQRDLDNGSINNSAVATGRDPSNTAVTSNTSTATVTVARTASISLTKTPSRSTVTAAGQTVTYTFVVTNTGNVTVTDPSVADSFSSPVGPAITPACPAGPIAPGGTVTCLATYTVTQADIDNGTIKNSAVASVKDPSGDTVTSAPAEATVTASETAGMTVLKAATPATVTAAGQQINYTFTVTNTGNVTLSLLHIIDTLTAPAAPVPAVTCPSTTIAPHDVVVCTATYTVTQVDMDNGSVGNSAIARATDPQGNPVDSPPSSTVVGATGTATLTLVKSAAPTTITAAGQRVTYTFAVKNTGTVTVGGIAITDTFTAPAGPPLGPITCAATTLAPNASTTCTAGYTATQDDVDNGSITNTATAGGTAPSGAAVTSNPSAATVTAAAAPALSLTKTAAPTTVTAAGQTVTYTFTVKNTGNVVVRAVAVDDPRLADDPDCTATTLDPAASATCTATYSVTQADIDAGTIKNTATASGTDPKGGPVTSPPAGATVDVTQVPALAVTKTASPTTVTRAGQPVTYTFGVTNTGTVTLHGIAIVDRFTAPAGPPLAPITCDTTTLAPAASTTCTATYATTQADVDKGSIVNGATASALDPAGNPVSSAPVTATVTVTRTPSLSLTKTADPAAVARAGARITYTFAVTNTGNTSISALAIDDTLAAPAGPQLNPITCAATALAPGASTTCSAAYTVTQDDADAGSVSNSATAGGRDPSGGPVTSPPSTATVTIAPVPSLSLVKAASPVTYDAIDQAITYTFTVTNTGTVTISGVAVADPMFPGAAAPTCADATLAPSASTTCTATYETTQADVDRGTIQNTATASGRTPKGAPVTSPAASATVTAVQTPLLQLTKTATPQTLTAVGESVVYRFTVTNAGNVTLDGLTVSDVFTAPATGGTVTCPATSLAPTESATCRLTYASTQADFDHGTIANTATASATDPSGGAVASNPSSALVTLVQHPALTLVKRADPATITDAGQRVVYTFFVTNSGTLTVNGLAIADTLAAPAGPELAPTCLATTLISGATTTCTATYTSTQDDIDNGSISNSAVARATDSAGTVASPPSTATVTADRTSGLAVVKSASPTSVGAAGDTVDYSFVVTNTGTVTMNDIRIDDAMFPGATAPSCPVTSLAPRQSTTCTATYRVQQADIDAGTFTNTATAKGSDPAGAPVTSDPSSATVTAPQTNGLSIVKTANATQPVDRVGRTVSFSFLVTNTGNTTLTGVAVQDTLAPPAGPALALDCPADTTLAPQETLTCTATYPATQSDIDNGSITNTATASGQAPDGSTVPSGPSTAGVPTVQTNSLTLVKSVDPATAAVGTRVAYSFLVTNNGTTTVTGLAIHDVLTAPATPVPTVTCPVTSLAPGTSTTCTAGYTVKQADGDHGSVVNTATATGTGPGGTAVTSNESGATVTVPQHPALTLVKTADPTTVAAVGQQVTYSFAVTNSGDVTIGDVAIDDTLSAPARPELAPTCPDTTLVPKQTTTCTATYTVTQDDLDNGAIDNTATASGTDPAGGPVTSDPSTATVTATQTTGLTLVKTADPTTVAAVGDTVTYTFAVTNNGTVTVTGLDIADTFTAPAGPEPAITCDATTLAPTKSTSCTGQYSVTQADLDAGAIKNSAVAEGTGPKGAPVTSTPSTATVTVDQAPKLSLTKSASPTSVDAAGDTVTYTFAVLNTGNVTVHGLSIADTLAAPAAPALAITCDDTTLAPGDPTTCTATYSVTQADVDFGSITNSAVADAVAPAGGAVASNDSTASVDVPQTTGLTLVKTADPTTATAAGQTVTYSFLVTNTGNVTISNVAIDDTLSAPAAPDLSVSCPTTVLAPARSTTCTGTYTVTQADVDHGRIDNTATAGGTDPSGSAVTSDPDTAAVTIARTSTLTLLKSASVSTVTVVGRAVTYSFLVTNSGNTTIDDVHVTDVFAAPAGPELTPTCPQRSLLPGRSTTCTADYTVTRDDLDNGSVSNTATAHGTDPTGAPVDSPESSVTIAATQQPALGLLKQATVDDVDHDGLTDLDDTITWTFTLTNLGNVTLTDLAVTDPTAGDVTCPVTTLAAGGSTVCTAAVHPVSQADVDRGVVDNTADATGTAPGGASVPSSESSTSTPVDSTTGISLVKTADPTSVDTAGDTVDYTFTVTNTGTTTLAGVSVDDTLAAPAGPALAVTCPPGDVAPGTSTDCTATYTVTQDDLDHGTVDNTATASATDPAGDTVTSDPSTATVTAQQSPELTLVKSASPATVTAVGDTVTYTFAVTNSGNVTVTDLAIDDTLAAPAGPALDPITCDATSLLPGKGTSCSATYSATQDDLDHGSIDNTATATGTAPNGDAVESDPSTATVGVVETPALTLVKSASPGTVSAVDDVVSYRFDVTNTGNVTVHGLTIDDTLAAPAGPALDVTCPVTTLAPTDATTCTGSYRATQDDLDHGRIDNTATARAVSPAGVTVPSNQSGATVDVDQAPALSVVKTADPTTVAAPGDTVAYSFLVTNTGNVTLHDVSVADTFAAPAGPSITPDCPKTTLAPTATTVCTASYTSIRADFDNGTIDNSAVASGTPPAGDPVDSDPSTASVTTTQTATLSLVKKAAVTDLNGNGYADLDDTIQWTFAVTNTGTVTLTDITIDDAVAGAVTCPAGDLAAGGTVTCTADTAHVISQADVDSGHVDNTATADGTSPNTGGDTVTSDPSSTTTPIGAQPGLALVKTGAVVDGNDNGVVDAGDTVVWKFVVTNTGNVTMSTITVNDPSAGPVTCAGTSLAPKLSTTCQADNPHRLTVADLDGGSVSNTASATGTPPSGPPVDSPPSTATVPLPAAPGLTIVKSASVTDTDDNGVNDAGDRVVWKFVVTNAGNVTLTGVRVVDPTAGTIDCPRTTLAPGARMSCTSAAHTITDAEAASGKVTNTATATGKTPSGDPVSSPPSTATVTIGAPSGTGGANGGGAAGGNSGGNVAYTGAKDLPLLLWFGGWSLLAGLLLMLLGVIGRRRRA